MAIGDVVSFFIGTAAGNRQPSSGVEEQISTLIQFANDSWQFYDGSNSLSIIGAGTQTNTAGGSGTEVPWSSPENLSIMITNSVYIRKVGTIDRLHAAGVQTNV